MKERLKGLWQLITGIGGLVIVLLFVMAFFGAFDDEAEKIGNAEILRGNDTKSVFSGESELIVTEDGEVVETAEKETMPDGNSIDAMTPDNKNYKNYLHLGETYENGDGTISMEVIDIDYKVFEVGDLVTTEIYVVIDVTNDGVEDLYLNQSNGVLFIDDYQVSRGANIGLFEQNGYYMCNGNVSYPTYVNISSGGRKGMIVFMVDIDNKSVTETSVIDFEVCGLVFKINPLFILSQGVKENTESEDRFAGTELEGVTTVEAHDGTYLCTDSNAVITVSENGKEATAQFTDGYDFEKLQINEKGIDAAGYHSYYIYDGDNIITIMFIGENGLYVEGVIGGWYDRTD